MIKGIGVDIIEIERVEKAICNDRFQKRVFTEYEINYIAQRPETAAGIFAAKEAAVKALGVGIGKVGFGDIEITHTEKGAPVISFFGNAAEIHPGCRAHISISHDKTKAVAFCVIDDKE